MDSSGREVRSDMTDSTTMPLDIIRSGKPCSADDSRGGSRKREEVLAVAAQCFLTRGYEGASVNGMSRRSGISKESIYRYFGSKKELFEAVIERQLEEHQRKLDRLDTTHGAMELREALVVVAETALTVLGSENTLALRRLVFDEARRAPELGDYYYRIGPERALATLRKLFTEHVVECAFDSEALSRYFLAMTCHGPILERECRMAVEPTRDSVARLAATVVDDFMSAFLRVRS